MPLVQDCTIYRIIYSIPGIFKPKTTRKRPRNQMEIAFAYSGDTSKLATWVRFVFFKTYTATSSRQANVFATGNGTAHSDWYYGWGYAETTTGSFCFATLIYSNCVTYTDIGVNHLMNGWGRLKWVCTTTWFTTYIGTTTPLLQIYTVWSNRATKS